MVSWALVNTLGLPVGVWLLQKALNYYRTSRQAYQLRQSKIRPTPREAQRALNILFTSALAFFLYTLPYFTPPNIFAQTGARIQTSTELIFSRLAAVPGHPNGKLTPREELLKAALPNTNARLVYLTVGPDVLLDCPFCDPGNPTSYYLYAAPLLALPHLAHLAALGLATSRNVAGAPAARWRFVALCLAAALAAADYAALSRYNMGANLNATSPAQLNFFHWRMRTARGVACAALDAGLAVAVWLTATNRFFTAPPSPAERTAALAGALDGANFRLWAAGNVRNAVVRDERLRDRAAAYWADEAEVYEDKEVVAAVQRVLKRNDMPGLERLAADRAAAVVSALDAPPARETLESMHAHTAVELGDSAEAEEDAE